MTNGDREGRIWLSHPHMNEEFSLLIKETKSVTMNIFRKKYFLFKSFVKIELSYVLQ